MNFQESPKLSSAPIDISEAESKLISEAVASTREHLEHHYYPGFGIFPSESTQGNFYNQVYARDLSYAAGNYFAETNPSALEDSLNTIFKYQRPNGMLPLRVEREYQQLKLWPGLRYLAKPLFNFFEVKIRGKEENPVYEGGDFGASGSEDTVPAILIATGEFFIISEKGREFAKNNFNRLKGAADFFQGKIDQTDGLAITTRSNADWADSLNRNGKLGFINVSWARALMLMGIMSKQLGHEDDAQKYEEEFNRVRDSIMKKIYNSEDGYFRAKAGEDRLDTVASVFGALYLLSPVEAVKVEETLKKRVGRSSGLQNFDPLYNSDEIFWGHRFLGRLTTIKNLFSGKKKMGMDTYHNKFVWPWVTCQNIQVKIKIALGHQDESVRNQYKKEAIEDLLKMSELFKKLEGFYELVDPEKPELANIAFYDASKNFMGSLAAYQGAYMQLKESNWI
jgi:glycogen debranching enzyme